MLSCSALRCSDRLLRAVTCPQVGDVGTVLEISADDDDDEPFQVQTADGKTWWYEDDGSLMRATAAAAKKKKKKPAAKKKKATKAPVPAAELTDSEEDTLALDADLGAEEEVATKPKRKATKPKAAKPKAAKPKPRKPAAAAPVEAGPLQVGDQVSIKPGGPQDGCLAENEIGQVMEVSQDEDDDEPYKVLAASGKSWWYEDGQLVKVGSAASAKKATGGQRGAADAMLDVSDDEEEDDDDGAGEDDRKADSDFSDDNEGDDDIFENKRKKSRRSSSVATKKHKTRGRRGAKPAEGQRKTVDDASSEEEQDVGQGSDEDEDAAPVWAPYEKQLKPLRAGDRGGARKPMDEQPTADPRVDPYAEIDKRQVEGRLCADEANEGSMYHAVVAKGADRVAALQMIQFSRAGVARWAVFVRWGVRGEEGQVKTTEHSSKVGGQGRFHEHYKQLTGNEFAGRFSGFVHKEGKYKLVEADLHANGLDLVMTSDDSYGENGQNLLSYLATGAA